MELHSVINRLRCETALTFPVDLKQYPAELATLRSILATRQYMGSEYREYLVAYQDFLLVASQEPEDNTPANYGEQNLCWHTGQWPRCA